MLVGFKAQNHPQQTAANGALDEVDDRATHPDDFARWDALYGPFTLDAAAAPHNAKVVRYFTRADNGLEQPWGNEKVWCNPPYSSLGDWLHKAWKEWPSTKGIVMLLPANRVEQKWWQEEVEPYRDRADGILTVIFLPGRLRFIKAGATEIKPNERPPFGCALLIWCNPLDAPIGVYRFHQERKWLSSLPEKDEK
jgi:phage N-6-adenine-methyltransferase